MENQIETPKDDQEFEKQLFNAFKHYGYLFPTTDEQVKSFESLYGNTDIQIPESLNNPEIILSKIKAANENASTKVSLDDHFLQAAFYTKSESFKISDDENVDEKETKN